MNVLHFNLILGLVLILIEDRTFAICKTREFITTFDQPSVNGNIAAEFHSEYYLVENNEYLYNTRYKLDDEPELKLYIKQQELLLEEGY